MSHHHDRGLRTYGAGPPRFRVIECVLLLIECVLLLIECVLLRTYGAGPPRFRVPIVYLTHCILVSE